MATEVGYGKTFNLGNYESERIDMRVPVDPGETPAQALDRARAWVEGQHARTDEVAQVHDRIASLKGQERDARGSAKQVLRQWCDVAKRYDELRALLAQHSVEIAALTPYLRPPETDTLPEPEPDEDDSDEDEDDDGDDRF